MKKLSGIELAFRTIFRMTPRLPRMVQIGITSKCNMTCKMCPRENVEIKDAHMPMATAMEIIDRITGVNRVALSGLGEPLLHPNLAEIIKYCKKQNIFVQTTTNGTLLNSPDLMRRIIQSGLDSLSISMEGLTIPSELGHNNGHIAKYVKEFIQLRKEMGYQTPKVVIQIVMLKEILPEIPDIIKWADQVGADSVNLSRTNQLSGPDLARPSENAEKKFFEILGELRHQYPIEINCLQDQIFPGILGRLYRIVLPLARLDGWCLKWTYYTYIREDGIVAPCSGFYPKDMCLGSIFEEDLEAIWNGPKYVALRRSGAKWSPCCECDNLRIGQREAAAAG